MLRQSAIVGAVVVTTFCIWQLFLSGRPPVATRSAPPQESPFRTVIWEHCTPGPAVRTYLD